jgi:hypothetical protein
MELVDLAAAVLLGLVPVLAIGGLIMFAVSNERRRRASQFKGPALTGTAQVVSAAPVTGWDLRSLGTQIIKARLVRLGLRMEIPGRPPYDATVTAPLMPRGTRLTVWVDSANPENVRIDFNQPITQPPPGSPYERPYDNISPVVWGLSAVGFIALIAVVVIAMIIAHHHVHP